MQTLMETLLNRSLQKVDASYLAKKLLATNSTGRIGYYLCPFMQFQLGNYIYARTNETHSTANIQDLIPILAGITIGNTS